MADHIIHEGGAKMGMTSSNPPRSRTAQTYSSPAKFAATPLRVGSRAQNTMLSGEPRMDAYIYRTELWCGPCIIKALVAERKAAPGAIDISPAEALEQIVSANVSVLIQRDGPTERRRKEKQTQLRETVP